ncbi:hypothetical protein [Marinomonas epiphytica]
MRYNMLCLGVIASCLSMPSWADIEYLEVTAGPYLSLIHYEEPGVMEEEGSLTGLTGQVTVYQAASLLSLEISYGDGAMDYQGTGRIEGIDNHLFEARALAGHSIPLSNARYLTVFIGLGYRELVDNAEGRVSTTGHRGYKRKQIYFYNPIGLELKTFVSGTDWSVSGRAEYDNFIFGRNTSYLGSIPGYTDIRLDQNEGHGYRFSLAFEKTINSQGAALIIEPYYRHWSIADSESTSDGRRTWIEPNNTSDEWGTALLLSF